MHCGRVSRTDLETERMREQDDDRAEEKVCTLSWADELRFYQCYWSGSLQRSIHPTCSVQPSDVLLTRDKVARRRTLVKGVEDERKTTRVAL